MAAELAGKGVGERFVVYGKLLLRLDKALLILVFLNFI